MLQKINDREIITYGEAREKYSNCQFVFVYTEDIDYGSDESKGYVTYTADEFSEFLQIPENEEPDANNAIGWGKNYNPEPYTVIGGIVCESY